MCVQCYLIESILKKYCKKKIVLTSSLFFLYKMKDLQHLSPYSTKLDHDNSSSLA